MGNDDNYNPNSLTAAVARIETALEGLVKSSHERTLRIDALLQEHAHQIESLQRWRFYVVGMAVAVGVGLKMAFDWLKR